MMREVSQLAGPALPCEMQWLLQYLLLEAG